MTSSKNVFRFGIARRAALACLFALANPSAPILSAADDPKPEAKSDGPAIAATFDGDPIYVAEIETVLYELQKNRQVNAQSATQAKADVLKLITQRRAGERVLRRDGYVKDSEIEKEVDKVKTQAGMQRLTLDQYLAKRRITLDTIRHEKAWSIGWEKYLEAKLGEALQTYFKEHHKELDGTQLRASHILLRAERAVQTMSQLMARAAQIREEIESGKISFEQAAEKYSVGPSRHQQGDLGYFPRYGVMSDDFGQAAFALEKGELSKPVASTFGVHLIKVTDLKPGSKQWTEAASQLKSPATFDLFEKLAKEELAKAKIEYTGKVPYYKPGSTKQIVVPTASASP